MSIDRTRYVAVDIEARGGSSFGALRQLDSIAWFSDTDSGCIVLKWQPGDEPFQHTWDRVLAGRIPVFHNAAYDVSVLRSCGVDVTNYHDSMILGYNLNPNMKVISVKGEKPSRYGISAWGVRFGIPKLEHPPWEEWWQSPTFYDELPTYNIRDAEVCWKVFTHCAPLLYSDPDAWNYYMNVDLPFTEVIMELNEVGMYIDIDALEDWEYEIECQMVDVYNQIVDLIGEGSRFSGTKRWHKSPHQGRTDGYYSGVHDESRGYQFIMYEGFQPSKEQHVREVYERLYNVTNLPNVQADFLEEHYGDFAFTQLLTEYRKLNKLVSTYCKPFRTKREADGYVRASWKALLITGRTSSENPSLQVLPKRDELGATFRKFVVAPPGYKLVKIDLSNIELRVMTALQALYFTEIMGYVPDDVQRVVDVFWNDPDTPEGDYHGVMTTLWFQIQHTDDFFKKYRGVSKNITFGRVYGSGIKKQAAQMKCDYKTAKERRFLADKNNPSFNKFHDWIDEEFFHTGGLGHTLYGRRLVYPTFNLDPDATEVQELPTGEIVAPNEVSGYIARGIRQAFNAKVGQGTAADILKIIAIAIAPFVWGMSARFVAQVHDELIFYVPVDKCEEFCRLLDIAVNRDDILPFVPVRGTPEVGDNWLETRPAKEIYGAVTTK